LNGKPIFLRGVNIHEEIPQRKARAFSDTDARVLINWASELGCNFVRLVHYPHNEFTIKFAEEKGIMVWEEIPVYQNIKFSDTGVERKMDLMLAEMISRDQNRCNVICWSVANETRSSKERDQALIRMAAKARSLDDTRMVTAAFDDVKYEGGRATLVDSVMRYFDVIGVNEYLGWYRPWPKDPGKMEWVSPYNKPMIISEFGGEALYNNEKAVADLASSWSEDYMALIYTDQLKMFKDIPFLQGICPWILADFRSPVRMHPVYQRGWNRKGLLSDQGEKKKAWYIIKTFYDLKKG
jgi:beta-glucuronidase